ncbi:MAG: DoxX family protein [Pseudomonadota bacterium]|nr:DoxX family protein [Pseudomonadota bacterium]
MLVKTIPDSWLGFVHAILRVMTGLLFLEHGTTKLFRFPLTEAYKDGVQLFSFGGLTASLEFIGGILIVIGLCTRVTSFVLSGMMAVAYFMAHAPKSFFPIVNMGELAVMFSFVFLYLAVAGAGPYSVDAMWNSPSERPGILPH